MNVQYAIKDGEIYVLEVNPRASRTVPFVAKTVGVPVAKIGALVMAGAPLRDLHARQPGGIGHVAVKEAVFPFARFPNVDTLLGPEMRSTGEAMGLDRDYADRLRQEPARRRRGDPGLRARSSSRSRTATSRRSSKRSRRLQRLGFRLIATSGTQRFLAAAEGIACAKVNKVLEGRPHIVDAIKNGEVQLVFNTTEGAQALVRQPVVQARGPLAQGALLHHHRGCHRGVAGDRGIPGRQP